MCGERNWAGVCRKDNRPQPGISGRCRHPDDARCYTAGDQHTEDSGRPPLH